MFAMNALTVISTDLLTPLGAYLRLRRGRRARFLLESVEHGRLGPPLVRRLRLAPGRRSRRPRRSAQPVVGYLGYDHAARLEPTVPLPDDGPRPAREPLRRRRHARPLRPRARDRRGALRRRRRGRGAARGPQPLGRRRPADARGLDPPASRRGTSTSARVVQREGAHPRGRRVPDRPLAARRAADLGVARSSSTARCGGSTRRRTSSCSSSTGSRSSAPRPRRSSSARAAAPALNPIAGTTRPGDGDAERLLASEKDRAEHVMLVDLGRNDLSRVCRPGTVRVERFLEPERFSHVTHLVSEVVGELEPDVTPFDLLRACFPAGTVSGAPKVRAMQIISELEGYRRGPYAGAVGYALPGRGARHVHRDPHDRPARRRRAACRRARGSSPTPTRPPSTRSACASWPRSRRRSSSRRRSGMILLVDNYDSFTYNLAHLFGELGAEVVVRRNDAIDADEAERLAPSHLVVSPGPGRPADAGASLEIVRRLGAERADARRLPRPPGDRRGLRRRDRPGAAARARQGERRRARRARALRGPARRASRPAATTRSPRPRCPDALEVSATRADGEVMAVRHRELPVDGVQFHPESVLTPLGPRAARATSWRRAMIQQALARLLDGHDLSRDEARDGDERDHGRRGDAGADRRLPRRAAAQGRDRRRDRRLRRGDARARARRAAEARRPRRHRRHRRRRRRTRSTSRPRRRSSRRRRAPASRSTATARSRRRRARRTCSRRSASRSSCRRARIERSIDELGFGFLFAPTHHPAMRHAAPVRRELAARTVFNVLGPLTNPAGARAQVVGVYAPALVPHDRRGARAARRAARLRRPRRGRDRRALARRARTSSARWSTASVREREIDPLDLGVAALRPGRAARRLARRERRRRSARSSAARTAASATRSCSTPPARSPRRATPTTCARGSSVAREAVDSRRGAERLDALVAFSQAAEVRLMGRFRDALARARPGGDRRGQAALAVGRRPAARRRPGRARRRVRARRRGGRLDPRRRALRRLARRPAPPRGRPATCRCSPRASSPSEPSSTQLRRRGRRRRAAAPARPRRRAGSRA